MTFSSDELERYDRHFKLAQFGMQKQQKLKQSKILIVGAGGLGCPIALYLGAAGVGNITIVDNDKIELSNLQRQIAFSTAEIGQFKAEILAKRVEQLNPLVKITSSTMRVDTNNVSEIIDSFDLVIDGTDNFASRFLIADTCYLAEIAYLHAAVYQFQGQVSLFTPGNEACFRCLFRQAPSFSALPACGESGILGSVTGIIGSIAATEAIKFLSGLGETLVGKTLLYDVLNERMNTFKIERDENCPLCSKNASIDSVQKLVEKQKEVGNCDRRLEMNEQIISVAKTVELLNDSLSEKPLLLDVREDHEYERGHLNQAHFWALSEIQSLPADVIRAKFKAILKEGIKRGSHGLSPQILCYCQRGARSLKATSLLNEAGINNVFSVEGGLDALTIVSNNRQSY